MFRWCGIASERIGRLIGIYGVVREEGVSIGCLWEQERGKCVFCLCCG